MATISEINVTKLVGPGPEVLPWHVVDIEIQSLKIAQVIADTGMRIWLPASE
jgi:hypothetical protein